MRIGEDGRLWAVNPEVRLLRRRTRHQRAHQPQRDEDHGATRSSPTSRSPRTATSGGRAWRTRRPAPPRGRARWTPESDVVSSHPNSRYCTPIKQCDILAPEYDDPRGVPIDAILFGGRRRDDRPAGLRGPRLDARHLPRRDALLRDHRRRGRRRSASSAVTRWRCCPSSATTPATTSTTGSPSAGQRRRQAAEDLLRQLVPA